MTTLQASKGPRRTVMLVGHHEKAIAEPLLWSLMRQYRPGRVTNGDDPITDETEKDEFDRWRYPNGFYSFSFFFPKPHQPKEARDNVELIVGMPASRFQMDNDQMAHMPQFERDSQHWFQVSAGRTRINYDNEFEMAWLLDKAFLTIPVFEPSFMFGDVQSKVVKNMGDHPTAKVWPVLVYGPEKVKAFGRERLLEAPVFRTDQLDYGGVFLQVARNPFMAKKGELRKLAEYLGLEMPDE